MKKRNVILLIVLMVVGFAAVSTTLYINGTATIGADQASFEGDVIFTKAETDEDGFAEIDETTKTKITFVSKTLMAVNEVSRLDFEVSNYSRNYDAVVKINCIVDEESEYAEYIKIEKDLILNDGEDEKDKYIIEAGKRKQGYITARLVKSYVGEKEEEISITCELNVEGRERDNLAEPLEEEPEECEEELICNSNTGNCYIDSNCNEELDLTEEVIINETEHFFVIASDSDNLDLLAKFNVDITNKKQYNASTPMNTYKTQFSKSTYWKCTSNKSEKYTFGDCFDMYGNYENLNKQTSSNATAINAAADYAQKVIGNRTKGRLLTIDDVEKLSTTNPTVEVTGNYRDILLGTYTDAGYFEYWLGSACKISGGPAYLWVGGCRSSKIESTDWDYPFPGVRPVIEVSKNLIVTEE
ncbi:MAG: hypothetical protein J1F35_04905 [Erysipelotrichales bacterium]|nr:hypothetical protein [Erysipelotrichales bacterium]